MRLSDVYMRDSIVQETLSDNAGHRQINSHTSRVRPETDHNSAAHSQVSALRSPFLLLLSLLDGLLAGQQTACNLVLCRISCFCPVQKSDHCQFKLSFLEPCEPSWSSIALTWHCRQTQEKAKANAFMLGIVPCKFSIQSYST